MYLDKNDEKRIITSINELDKGTQIEQMRPMRESDDGNQIFDFKLDSKIVHIVGKEGSDDD